MSETGRPCEKCGNPTDDRFCSMSCRMSAEKKAADDRKDLARYGKEAEVKETMRQCRDKNTCTHSMQEHYTTRAGGQFLYSWCIQCGALQIEIEGEWKLPLHWRV